MRAYGTRRWSRAAPQTGSPETGPCRRAARRARRARQWPPRPDPEPSCTILDLRWRSGAPIRNRSGPTFAYIGGLPCQAWEDFLPCATGSTAPSRDGRFCRWFMLSGTLRVGRNCGSCGPGFPAASPPSRKAPTVAPGRRPKSRLHLIAASLLRSMVQVGPRAAAIQGAETTRPALFRRIFLAALAAALLTPDGAAFAGLGQPSPWQIGLQQSGTPVMDDIVWFHDLLLWVIGAITLFVLALLAIIVVKFNARANPTPSRTTHHTLLEVAWTVVPVII